MFELTQAKERLLGGARIARYRADCGGDLVRATRLFDWNLRMAGAVYESLYIFELALRNTMDLQLRTWNRAQGFGEEWLVTPDPRLERLLRPSTLHTARSRAVTVARRAGRAPLHDDIVAQITFGTWRYLLPSNSSIPKQRLWTDCLNGAFPNWSAGWPPIVRRVEIVHDLRNRVAHLESLHRQELRKARQAMRHVVSAMGKDSSEVFGASERMLIVIQELDEILV
jgi:hypothetical protein